VPVSFLWRAAVGVLFLAILIWAVQTVPEWQVRRAGVLSAVTPEAKTTPADVANLQNEMRRTFLQVVGGAFALFALYLTFRRVVVAEQGHITDRYTKAIEQLGAMKAENKPNVEVRLGAIYALERIAQDSPRDHWTIMEVLTAYVRQNAPAPVNAPTKTQNRDAIAKGPATEIQAILTVLGRRRRNRGREHMGQQLDLKNCDLRAASFEEAHIEGVIFDESHLEGANFFDAHIEWASFANAYIEEANFSGSHGEGARFIKTHMDGATFSSAYMKGAIFGEARMKGTSFVLARLEGAFFINTYAKGTSFDGAHVEGTGFWGSVGLAVEQIQSSEGWERAHFDDAFQRELEEAKRKGDNQGKISS
jgi:uncharacterized protein YjbI with pentapeptide repeats